MTEPMTDARLDEIDRWCTSHHDLRNRIQAALENNADSRDLQSAENDADAKADRIAEEFAPELVTEVRRLRAELDDTRTLVAKSCRADLDRHAAHVLTHAAGELRAMHPAVYEDAGQRTADGILRAADALERQARDTQLAAKEA